MKYILLSILTLTLTACGTTSTTTTTKYDESGNITEVIVVESDVSDFGTLIARGDGKATAITLSATKFALGQNGASYFSVSGTSTTAPADNTTSAQILEASASVINATKTEISSDVVSINTSKTETQEEGDATIEE